MKNNDKNNNKIKIILRGIRKKKIVLNKIRVDQKLDSRGSDTGD